MGSRRYENRGVYFWFFTAKGYYYGSFYSEILKLNIPDIGKIYMHTKINSTKETSNTFFGRLFSKYFYHYTHQVYYSLLCGDNTINITIDEGNALFELYLTIVNDRENVKTKAFEDKISNIIDEIKSINKEI
jgi:hypothetical protein